MIWNTLDQFRIAKKKLKLNKQAVILHGGGWKKLQSLNITDEMFKDKIRKSLGISKVINYYGMVEQTVQYLWNVLKEECAQIINNINLRVEHAKCQ